MVTKTTNSGSITFPNKYVFAFNPNYIDFNLESSINSVEVSVASSAKEFNITCSLYKGKGKCYISRILQLLFDDDYLTHRVEEATIAILNNGENIGQTTLTIMWGCIRLGDPFGLGEVLGKFKQEQSVIERKTITFYRETKWFKRFPCSISFFAPSGSKDLKATIDGGKETVVDIGNQPAILDVQPSADAKNQIIYSIAVDKEAIASTFPFVFDDTFGKSYQYTQEKLRVIVSDETEGYYIRWIDQYGFIQYWLFKKGTITHKNKLGSNTKPIKKELNSIYYGNIERITSIENTETHKCAAISLNENMLRTVETIIKSPYVDLFLGYNQKNEEVWLPINVVAGSYKVSQKKVLQDYEIQFTMPDTASQTL